jgi:hypothetical protein
MTRKRMLRRVLNFGRSELEINNAEILRTPGLSTIQLPPLFAIWRHGDHTRTGSRTDPEQAYTAVLVSVSRVQQTQQQTQQQTHQQPTLWKFELVQQPIEAIYHGTCELSADNWLGDFTPTIIVRRESSIPEESGKLYLTTVTHTGHMIRCHTTGTRIPVFKIPNKCLILPSRFTTIDSPGNTVWRFSLRYGGNIVSPSYVRRQELRRTAIAMTEASAQRFLEAVVVTVAAAGGGGAGAVLGGGGAGPAEIPMAYPTRQQGVRQQQQQPLPQHIVNAYIDDIIRKREECPIEMTHLTRENAALTPCGHAVQQSAGTRWILSAHSCPVCRLQCSPDQLQTWKA